MTDRRDLALLASLAIAASDAPLGQRLEWRRAVRDYMDGKMDVAEMEGRINGALGLEAGAS